MNKTQFLILGLKVRHWWYRRLLALGVWIAFFMIAHWSRQDYDLTNIEELWLDQLYVGARARKLKIDGFASESLNK